MFGFGDRYQSVAPIIYTEITRVGDEVYRKEIKIGEVKTNDLLMLMEAMKKISSEVRI